MQVNFPSFKSQNTMQYKSFSNQKDNIAFGSIQRHVNDISGKLLYRNNSSFFRTDLNWESAVNYIMKQFPNGTKITTLACSDGSEPYSIAMMLVDKLGIKNAQKYFPIMAYDIDKEIIAKAKIGVFFVDSADVSQSLACLRKHDIKDFFEKPDRWQSDELIGKLKLSEELKNAVTFEQGDAVKIAKSSKESTPVVFARNFFPYLKPKARVELIETLGKNIPPKGILALGDYDFSWQDFLYNDNHFGKIIQSNGFYRWVSNIFIKQG